MGDADFFDEFFKIKKLLIKLNHSVITCLNYDSQISKINISEFIFDLFH
jgi:hypothetical protein